MLGDFQLDSSERYDDFLSSLGVNWFVRQIVTRMKPIQKIRQNGKEVEIQTVTAFTNTASKFKLDEPYTDDQGGAQLPTLTYLDGDKLRRFRTPDQDSEFDQPINEVREYEDDGRKMILTLSLPDQEDVWTKRVFKKVADV